MPLSLTTGGPKTFESGQDEMVLAPSTGALPQRSVLCILHIVQHTGYMVHAASSYVYAHHACKCEIGEE